jgi:hypothetical protein
MHFEPLVIILVLFKWRDFICGAKEKDFWVSNGCEDRRRLAMSRQLLSCSNSKKKPEHWEAVLLQTLTPLFKAIQAF